LEDTSNRSLFKISEESLNNIHNSSINYMYISFKSTHELNSKANRFSGLLNTQHSSVQNNNKHRIYSTIDSPKMIKKKNETNNSNAGKGKIASVPYEDEPAPTQPSSSSLLNLADDYCKFQKNNDNYYDIANTPKDTWDITSSFNLTKRSRQAFKLMRRSQSDITLNLFEKLIKKHQLSNISNLNSSEENFQKKELAIKSNNEMNASKVDAKAFINDLVKYKFDSENLAKKINLLTSNSSIFKANVLSQSNSSQIDITKFNETIDNSINNFINPAAPWKRLGAKSLPDLLLLPDYVNYSAKNIQLEKDFPQDGERTCSGGLLLSSFSQQLHYEYLKPFRSTLECAQMLRKIKKLSSRIYSII
jgi:hypothetical protein